MKKLIKVAIFPILTVLLFCGLLIYNKDAKNKMVAEEVSGADGLIYADYFTGNAAHYEWQFEYNDKSKSPKFINDMMMMDGFASIPSFAMLQYTLPEKCDIYFTIEVARRGEGDNRDPAVFLNVGENFQNRYMLYFKEKAITFTYNGTENLINKRVDELTVRKAYSFRISLDGKTMTLYMDQREEPIFTYTATDNYANFSQARNFGVWGTASEFYFDDLVVTNGSDYIPVRELAISGDEKNEVEGIDTQMQMKACLNPSNSTDRALVWSVDDRSIADITSGGLLTAKKYGTVMVTARTRDSLGVVASCKVVIKKVTGAKEGEEISKVSKSWNLANDYSVVYESENPDFLYPMSPYITVLKSGRIIVLFDLNGDGLDERIPVGYDKPVDWGPNKQHVVVAYSDDGGETWTHSYECPGLFPRAFEDGEKLYLIRRDENRQLAISYSDDEGETWSESFIIDERAWSSAPTSIIYKGEYLYMTMETAENSALCPVLMRAKCGDDLTKTESWTFSEPISLEDIVGQEVSDTDYTGIRVYSNPNMGTGWLEGNVIQMYDKTSAWYDETMNSFYILLRGQVFHSGYAAVVKVTENEDGTMTPSKVQTEEGNTQLYLAMPGGHDKFSIIYDEASQLYWLASSYSDNSIISQKYVTGDMQGGPWLERNELALYFSKDALNWNFAGMIAEGDSERESRAYPHLAIDGEDLLVVTRCGTEESRSLHDNNIISMHRIKNYRDLVY